MNLALVLRKFILAQKVVIANAALDTITFTIRLTMLKLKLKVKLTEDEKRNDKQINEKKICLADEVNNRKQRNGLVLE